MKLKKLALNKEKKIWPIYDLTISVNLPEGAIDREQLLSQQKKENKNGVVKTSKDKPVFLCDPTFKDAYDRMKRGPASIIEKDVGMIIALIGLTKNSVILEAGSGMGALTAQLAALCKHVYSYEIHEKHLKIAKDNVAMLDLDNITFVCDDVTTTTQLPEKKVDAAIFDLPNPQTALATAKKVLKDGGYLVFYTPQITQAQEVFKSLGEEFKYLTTLELIQRRWEIDDKVLRPKHSMLGHTAFLTVIRYFSMK
ncbi:MAG: methyltransferase domain-containing protein [Candidatus Nanoarchaeia archaeon]